MQHNLTRLKEIPYNFGLTSSILTTRGQSGTPWHPKNVLLVMQRNRFIVDEQSERL